MTDKDVIDTLNNVLSKVAKLEEGFDAKLLEISELKKEINHLKECNIADTKSIAELEKRINDSLLLPTIITHGRDHTTLTTQIAELKEQLNNYSVNIFHRNDINLNREVLRELKQNMISPILYGLWRKEIFFTNEYQEIYNNGLEIEHKLEGGEKPPKFKCGHCGMMFETYHDGEGYNTGLCPDCFEKEQCDHLKYDPPGSFCFRDCDKKVECFFGIEKEGEK